MYTNVHYMNLDRFLKFSLSVSDLYLFTLVKQYKRNNGLLGLGCESLCVLLSTLIVHLVVQFSMVLI